jgi:hypothetical protein
VLEILGWTLACGAGMLGLWWMWTKAAAYDAQQAWLQEREADEALERESIAWGADFDAFSDLEREPEFTEADLDAAIKEWRESLAPMTPEQKERSWRKISASLPEYPRRSVVRTMGARGIE